MNSVDEDTIMITVFGRRTTVGLVRFLFRERRAECQRSPEVAPDRRPRFFFQRGGHHGRAGLRGQVATLCIRR